MSESRVYSGKMGAILKRISAGVLANSHFVSNNSGSTRMSCQLKMYIEI